MREGADAIGSLHVRGSPGVPESVSYLARSPPCIAAISKGRAARVGGSNPSREQTICGNIAEGFGKQRRSSAEFKRYLLMAIGSADEMQVWLRYCADLQYLDQKMCAEWRDEYRQIAKMLQGLYSTVGTSSDH